MQILIKEENPKYNVIFTGRYKGHGRNVLGVISQLMRNKKQDSQIARIIVGKKK